MEWKKSERGHLSVNRFGKAGDQPTACKHALAVFTIFFFLCNSLLRF